MRVYCANHSQHMKPLPYGYAAHPYAWRCEADPRETVNISDIAAHAGPPDLLCAVIYKISGSTFRLVGLPKWTLGYREATA